MNAGPFASLISEFAENWVNYQPALNVSLVGTELEIEPSHPLHGELFALCCKRSASLPFFSSSADIAWCTVAPDSDSLRQAWATLSDWVLPSFGGAKSSNPHIRPGLTIGGLTAKIFASSPEGYYRWRCPRQNLDLVLEKLQLFRSLENVRPARVQPPRPSLYELRARFASALLVGDRVGAEAIIGQLDLFQLDTAVNTQFMRIRMWHYFGEFERIRNHQDLHYILAQPIPPRVRAWIDEACGGPTLHPTDAQSETPIALAKLSPPNPPHIFTWIDWIGAVKSGRREAAEAFLQEHQEEKLLDLTTGQIEVLCDFLDELTLDDALRYRERDLILPAVAEIAEQYIRDTEFPCSRFGKVYLSLLRTWGLLHKGNSTGHEHGHVLLELASASLQLNINAREVCETLEEWWKSKPVPSQLNFALDAIELIGRELPDPQFAVNLWIEAAEVIKRAADSLPRTDREFWRQVGYRLGFDKEVITQYLPTEPLDKRPSDLLAVSGINHIAIVCLREQQARQAAEEIRERCGAKVTIVMDKNAGLQTAQACTADVVLFVWAAATHATFRGFDGFNRQRFCYVQGTGPSSIVRALERWLVKKQSLV